ncbi:MAG: rhodanese-like domain-containing protein [Chloroflexaceae bacterium]|nr:rhodanese-like domain-containing protein [Chloroflexaceae bacterium]
MRELFRLVLLALAALTLGACGVATRPAGPAPGPGSYANISVAELKARLEAREPLILLDVRSPEEYTQDGHVAGSMLIPLPELARRMGELDGQRPIVCICRSGNRSRTACEQLARAGFTNLANVEGGMRAWAAAGYAMERP